MSNPICTEPGCGLEMVLMYDCGTDFGCLRSQEEHRLCARVHELEAKLADADKGFLSYVEDVESLRYSLGKDVLDENLQLNNESVAAHAVALAREAERQKGKVPDAD